MIMMTNALRQLNAMGIVYEARDYEVDLDDLSANAVAKKIGMELDQVFKTLVVVGDKSGPFMALIPGSAELDLKKCAKASANKACSMLALKELEPLTGYVRGGCSPVGAKKKLRVYIDETIELWDIVSVSAGARGLQMLLAPVDLIRATEASLADLVNQS
jgi:Cys-tRNA(Pro)/Cys-tRNA(Cys) deacylase